MNSKYLKTLLAVLRQVPREACGPTEAGGLHRSGLRNWLCPRATGFTVDRAGCGVQVVEADICASVSQGDVKALRQGTACVTRLFHLKHEV